MTKEQLIKLAGSQSELARILGITRAAVNQWPKIPEGRLWQLRAIRPEWFTNEVTTFGL
jgi:DNA-binding transcriptional regulator YdaS (Cro superfamily)